VRSGLHAAAVDQWTADIQTLTADGEYLFAPVRFVFVAQR
jgi:hypothetical protein